MRVLVVLVLVVFSGCNADVLYADQPKPKLDELTDAFWGYVETATRPAENFFHRMLETKFGEDLRARLKEGAGMVKTNIQRFKNTWSHAPEEVKRFTTGLSYGIYAIAVTVEEQKTNIKKNLEPVAETLAPVTEKIFSVLTEETEHVRNIAFPYVKKMVERVENWSKELLVRLDTLYDSSN